MHKLKCRFKLAWWAFRHPNNLTMLRHEMVQSAKAQEFSNSYHSWLCTNWVGKYLKLPIH